MIDERGLVAAIKDTWRHEGYAVAGYGSGDERALCLNGASWLAVMPPADDQPEGAGAAAVASGGYPGCHGMDRPEGPGRSESDDGHGAGPYGQPAAADR